MFRDPCTRELGSGFSAPINVEGVERRMQPFDLKSFIYGRVMKTDAVKRALHAHGIWAFGCCPLTVAVESNPETKEQVIQKTIAVASTEQYSRLI